MLEKGYEIKLNNRQATCDFCDRKDVPCVNPLDRDRDICFGCIPQVFRFMKEVQNKK